MIIEKFSQNLVNSGIFKMYIAAGFFATSIFFVLNANIFTPFEMVLGIILMTIVCKGISNIMLGLMIMFFDLENKKEELDFNYHADRINSMMGELDEKANKNKGE